MSLIRNVLIVFVTKFLLSCTYFLVILFTSLYATCLSTDKNDNDKGDESEVQCSDNANNDDDDEGEEENAKQFGENEAENVAKPFMIDKEELDVDVVMTQKSGLRDTPITITAIPQTSIEAEVVTTPAKVTHDVDTHKYVTFEGNSSPKKDMPLSNVEPMNEAMPTLHVDAENLKRKDVDHKDVHL